MRRSTVRIRSPAPPRLGSQDGDPRNDAVGACERSSLGHANNAPSFWRNSVTAGRGSFDLVRKDDNGYRKSGRDGDLEGIPFYPARDGTHQREADLAIVCCGR
jgi:hypothetical protein